MRSPPRRFLPLLQEGTRTLHMVFEQRDRTLKDALSILQIALLGGSKTLCQRLVGLAESFDWTCGRFLFLFVCHGFAPS